MIQPISSINFNNYSYRTNFKAKVPFTGFYDPTCVSHVGEVKVLTLSEELKHELKPLIDSITTPIANALKTKKDSVNIISKDGTTLYHPMPDGTMIPIAIKDKVDPDAAVKDSLDKFKEKYMSELTDNANETITETTQDGSVLTHLLYDGSGSIDIPVAETVDKTTILDAANIIRPNTTSDSGILDNLLEQSDNLSDLSDAGDALSTITSSTGDLAGEVASTALDKLAEHADDIQDLLDILH